MADESFVFNLGDSVGDRITAFKGIVTSRSQHLFGCARYWVEPRELKDGKPVEGRWFDEDSLELVEAGVIKPKRYRVYETDANPYDAGRTATPIRRAGGPTDQPASHARQSTR